MPNEGVSASALKVQVPMKAPSTKCLSREVIFFRYMGLQRFERRDDKTILSYLLRNPKNITVDTALELLTTLRGPDMLRVKGIVNVEGKPVVVQGVQHIFSPPIELDQWPSADRDSRLVFITRNIESDTIRNLMSAVTSLGASSPTAA